MKKTFDHLSAERKEEIINACILEFGLHGYEKTTTDAIIRRIGISKGGLYEYISSKRELFVYVVTYTYAKLYGYLQKRIGERDDPLPGDLLDRVYIVSSYAIDFYIEHPGFVSLIVRTYQITDDDLAKELEAVFTSRYLDIFGDASEENLRFGRDRIIEVLMWLLLKTRYDFLLEMRSGKEIAEIKKDYMENWDFYISIMRKGIYRRIENGS